MREFEERPLIPFEIDSKREGKRRYRLEPEPMQQLHHDIHVAVRLGPAAFLAVDGVALVGRGVEFSDDGGHSFSTPRTSDGQVSGSIPCVAKSARATRSSPKPTQEV